MDPKTVLDAWQSEHELTIKVIRAIPDDALATRAGRKGKTLGEMAWHLAASERWFVVDGLGVETAEDHVPRDEPPATAEAMADAFEASHADLFAGVEGRDEAWFAEEVDLHDWTITRIGALDLLQRHAIHHRGQMTTLLRIAGAWVPAVYGPTADDTGTLA